MCCPKMNKEDTAQVALGTKHKYTVRILVQHEWSGSAPSIENLEIFTLTTIADTHRAAYMAAYCENHDKINDDILRVLHYVDSPYLKSVRVMAEVFKPNEGEVSKILTFRVYGCILDDKIEEIMAERRKYE